jgi:trans-aconitate 2-methyltransferase
MPTWDANLYLKFASERTQPSLDLIARIGLAEPARIIDLGCGPGNSTLMLRRRWPRASLVGLDNAEAMIKAAREAYPHEQWVLEDAASWTADEPYDIVFSNAALQWLPDHANLFPHLLNQVAPGGVLAVQMPAHYASPLHHITLEVADDAAWRHLMEGPRNALTKKSPSFYYDALQPFASRVELWETEYYHVVNGPQSIVDWFRGTGLRPFLEALETPAQQERFLSMMLEGYTRAYPRQKDGRVLFPFRRLFIIAIRK